MKKHFRLSKRPSEANKPASPAGKTGDIAHYRPSGICPLQQSVGSPDKNVLKAIAAIATNAWKAKIKMIDSATGEVREDMKRVYRHVEGVLESLAEIGIEVKDHTGEAFDYGMQLKIVTTQPTPGITKEKVLETIKPTVYCQKTSIIQEGEVVVATPIQQEEKA